MLVISCWWCLFIQEYLLLIYKDIFVWWRSWSLLVTQFTLSCVMYFSIVPSQPIIGVHSLFSFLERMLADQLSFPCPAIAAAQPLSLAPRELPAVYLWWSLPSSKADIQGHVIILNHASQHEGCTPVLTDGLTSDVGVGFGAFFPDISWCGRVLSIHFKFTRVVWSLTNSVHSTRWQWRIFVMFPEEFSSLVLHILGIDLTM